MDRRVTLHSRDIKAPGFDEAVFGVEYEPIGEVWASVKTINGATRWNGVSRDEALTHSVGIRFLSEAMGPIWVELDTGEFLRTVDQQDLDERHEYILLDCTHRGPAREAAAATV